MNELFGNQFIDYSKKTRRWIWLLKNNFMNDPMQNSPNKLILFFIVLFAVLVGIISSSISKNYLSN
jgi:hypothetical protein